MGLGVACCFFALIINMAPSLAYKVGVDPKGVWQAFSFGIFLIAIGAFSGRSDPGKGHRNLER